MPDCGDDLSEKIANICGQWRPDNTEDKCSQYCGQGIDFVRDNCSGQEAWITEMEQLRSNCPGN